MLNIYKYHNTPEKIHGNDMDKTLLYPQLVYNLLKKQDYSKYSLKQLESIISKYSGYAEEYAQYIIEKPFPLGEDSIANDTDNSFAYAKHVLKGAFPKGEEAIARNAYTSFEYAVNVIKERFPLGEEAIKENPEYYKKYLEFLRNKEQ